MTVTTDHFHEQIGRTIYDELDYLNKDIDHYDVPIRIQDALKAAQEELVMCDNLMTMNGMKKHLKIFKRAIDMIKVCREAIAAQPIDAFGTGTTDDGETYPIRDQLLHDITVVLEGEV